MTIYILKELNQLDSGEKSFNVSVFKQKEGIQEEMANIRDNLIEEGYSVAFENENCVELFDNEKNLYQIQVELSCLNQ